MQRIGRRERRRVCMVHGHGHILCGLFRIERQGGGRRFRIRRTVDVRKIAAAVRVRLRRQAAERGSEVQRAGTDVDARPVFRHIAVKALRLALRIQQVQRYAVHGGAEPTQRQAAAQQQRVVLIIFHTASRPAQAQRHGVGIAARRKALAAGRGGLRGIDGRRDVDFRLRAVRACVRRLAEVARLHGIAACRGRLQIERGVRIRHRQRIAVLRRRKRNVALIAHTVLRIARAVGGKRAETVRRVRLRRLHRETGSGLKAARRMIEFLLCRDPGIALAGDEAVGSAADGRDLAVRRIEDGSVRSRGHRDPHLDGVDLRRRNGIGGALSVRVGYLHRDRPDRDLCGRAAVHRDGIALRVERSRLDRQPVGDRGHGILRRGRIKRQRQARTFAIDGKRRERRHTVQAERIGLDARIRAGGAAGLEPDLAVRHSGREQRHERRLIARPALAVRGLAAVAVVLAVLADVAAVERRVRRGIHPALGIEIGQRAEVLHAELCRMGLLILRAGIGTRGCAGRIVEADRAEPVARRQRDLLFHRACHGQRAVDAVRAAVRQAERVLPCHDLGAQALYLRHIAVAVRQRELRGRPGRVRKGHGVLCAVQNGLVFRHGAAQCGKKRRQARLVRRPQAGQRRRIGLLRRRIILHMVRALPEAAKLRHGVQQGRKASFTLGEDDGRHGLRAGNRIERIRAAVIIDRKVSRDALDVRDERGIDAAEGITAAAQGIPDGLPGRIGHGDRLNERLPGRGGRQIEAPAALRRMHGQERKQQRCAQQQGKKSNGLHKHCLLQT